MDGFSIIEFDLSGMEYDVTAEYELHQEQEWRDDYFDCPEYKQYVEEWE